MSSVIVLAEMEPLTEVVDSAEVDIGPRVRWIHAAGADPDAPMDPLPRTLCGLDSTEMEPEQYRPSAPARVRRRAAQWLNLQPTALRASDGEARRGDSERQPGFRHAHAWARPPYRP
jgi:hypothetical protein